MDVRFLVMTKRYYKIHKLCVKSDFDINIPQCFSSKKLEDTDISIEIKNTNIENLDSVAPPYLFYGKDKLVHSYGLPIPCNLSIENLEGKTVLGVTNSYRRMPNIDVNEIIDFVLEIKLLQKELVKLHSACIKVDGVGILIAGWGGSGKSTLAFKFLEKGAEVLSEDITIVDKEMAYSYPGTIKVFKGLNFLTKSLNGVPYINKLLRSYERVQIKKTSDSTNVQYIFISRYGDKNIRKLSFDDVLKDVMTLAIYMVKRRDTKNLPLAYCYYNKYDYASLIESRRDILKKFLSGVNAYEITSKTPAESMELIEGVISKNS